MRRDLHTAEANTWRGLLVDVAQPDRPGLRVESTVGRRFRIVQGDDTILWCRIQHDNYGVDVAFDHPITSVIEPIRSTAVRKRGDETTWSRWRQRWAHYFVDQLDDTARGPLHAGFWTIRPRSGYYVHDELCGTGQGLVNWDSMQYQRNRIALPTRPLSNPDDGRVKAYRKMVADETLPPVLLWFVGGLMTGVIIDGHDRLVAALAEGIDPPVLEVERVLSVNEAHARKNTADIKTLEELDRLLETQPHAVRHHESLARYMVTASADVEEIGSTLAWPSSVPVSAWPAFDD